MTVKHHGDKPRGLPLTPLGVGLQGQLTVTHCSEEQ